MKFDEISSAGFPEKSGKIVFNIENYAFIYNYIKCALNIDRNVGKIGKPKEQSKKESDLFI